MSRFAAVPLPARIACAYHNARQAREDLRALEAVRQLLSVPTPEDAEEVPTLGYVYRDDLAALLRVVSERLDEQIGNLVDMGTDNQHDILARPRD